MRLCNVPGSCEQGRGGRRWGLGAEEQMQGEEGLGQMEKPVCRAQSWAGHPTQKKCCVVQGAPEKQNQWDVCAQTVPSSQWFVRLVSYQHNSGAKAIGIWWKLCSEFRIWTFPWAGHAGPPPLPAWEAAASSPVSYAVTRANNPDKYDHLDPDTFCTSLSVQYS